MLRQLGLLLAAGLLAAGISLGPAADAAKDKDANGRDRQSLADKLVTQCLRINDKDLVLITGGVNDAELLEDLAVNVRKAGGQSQIELVSARLSRRLVDDVPA